MDEILDLLTADEVQNRLRFAEVTERGQHMSQAEAGSSRPPPNPCHQ